MNQSQTLAPSPAWERAMPPGPDARIKITEPWTRPAVVKAG
jgi:hypothetical protein